MTPRRIAPPTEMSLQEMGGESNYLIGHQVKPEQELILLTGEEETRNQGRSHGPA